MKRSMIYLVIVSFIITFSLFYSSCNGDKSKKEMECPVAVIGNRVIDPLEIPLSDIAASITVIPLETNDSVLLNERITVHMVDDYFLINNRELLLFDRNGKFIRKVTGIGQGPAEVPFIADLWVRNNLIYVTSNRFCKVFDFDGKLRESYQLPLYAEVNLMITDNKFIGGDFVKTPTNPRPRLAFFTKDEILKQLQKPYEVRQGIYNRWGKPVHFKESQNEYYVKEIFCDTIYRIDAVNDTIIPFLTFDFGRYKGDPSQIYLMSQDEVIRKMPYMFFIGLNEHFVFLTAYGVDYSKQKLVDAVCYYDRKEKTAQAVQLAFTDEHKELLRETLKDGYNEETEKYFLPVTMSADGNHLIYIMMQDNDENQAIILATLKK